jgi:hypothetical protein
MPDLERWEDIVNDLRADAKRCYAQATKIEEDSGKDKRYGARVGEACAFEAAANRIAGEIEELRHA